MTKADVILAKRKQIDEMKKQVAKLETEERKRKRMEDTHCKIVVGAAVTKMISDSPNGEITISRQEIDNILLRDEQARAAARERRREKAKEKRQKKEQVQEEI